MKQIKNLLENVKSNYEFKVFLTATLTFIINVGFLLYNLIFGVIYNVVWNYSISFYYAVLILLRSIVLFSEKNWRNKDTLNLQQKRLNLFRIICWCGLIMDFSLFAPITLMVLFRRAVNVGMIPTIAIAAYTTYKVTLAIVNYCRKKSKPTFSLKALRLIALKDAIVSVLTLQNTMVTVFGEGNSMFTLTAVTSALFLVALVAISVFSIISAKNA